MDFLFLMKPGACPICGEDHVCEECINAELRAEDEDIIPMPDTRINIASGEDAYVEYQPCLEV